MPFLYDPAPGQKDTILADIQAAADLDCGDLNGPKNLAVRSLKAARNAVWAGADAYKSQQSNPLYASYAARSDAQARTVRAEMDKEILAGIQATTDQTVATVSFDALKDLADGVRMATARLSMPSALQKFDPEYYQQNQAVQTELRVSGCVQMEAGYDELVHHGELDEVELYERAGLPYAMEVSRGGTATLAKTNRANEKNAGWATAEVNAANSFISKVQSNRANRMPETLANAKVAYQLLETCCALLCGEHVAVMSLQQRMTMYLKDTTIPNALQCDHLWGIRWITAEAPLPGWSEIIERTSPTAATRAPKV